MIRSRPQVNKLRDQCQKQEETIKEQETELDSRKQELQKLRDEESALEKEYDTSLKEKEKISVQLQETQLQISQVRAMTSQLEETQRQMRDALVLCKGAIEENNAAVISDYSLNIEPDFREFKAVLLSPEEKAKDGECAAKFPVSHHLTPCSFPQLSTTSNRRTALSTHHNPPHSTTALNTKDQALVTTGATRITRGMHRPAIRSQATPNRIPLEHHTYHQPKM